MLYHWLFLIPFLLAGFLVAGITLWRIMERTEVRIAGKRASVCTGVGSLGRQTHFDPTQIKGIQLQGSYSGKTCETFMIKVQMHGGKHIEFGSGISSERLHYLLSAFKATIRGQEKSRHGSPPHKGHI